MYSCHSILTVESILLSEIQKIPRMLISQKKKNCRSMIAKLQQRNIGIPFLSKNIHLKMDKKRKERNGDLLAVIG